MDNSSTINATSSPDTNILNISSSKHIFKQTSNNHYPKYDDHHKVTGRKTIQLPFILASTFNNTRIEIDMHNTRNHMRFNFNQPFLIRSSEDLLVTLNHHKKTRSKLASYIPHDMIQYYPPNYIIEDDDDQNISNSTSIMNEAAKAYINKTNNESLVQSDTLDKSVSDKSLPSVSDKPLPSTGDKPLQSVSDKALSSDKANEVNVLE